MCTGSVCTILIWTWNKTPSFCILLFFLCLKHGSTTETRCCSYLMYFVSSFHLIFQQYVGVHYRVFVSSTRCVPACLESSTHWHPRYFFIQKRWSLQAWSRVCSPLLQSSIDDEYILLQEQVIACAMIIKSLVSSTDILDTFLYRRDEAYKPDQESVVLYCTFKKIQAIPS